MLRLFVFVSATRLACAFTYLVAGTTHAAGHDEVHRSHEWRKNVNSFYTTDGPAVRELRRVTHAGGFEEVWVERPDGGPECVGCDNCVPPNCMWTCADPKACGWCGHMHTPGCHFHEQRYVSTPSMANLTFWGRYDWLAYADAETVWLTANMDSMLVAFSLCSLCGSTRHLPSSALFGLAILDVPC